MKKIFLISSILSMSILLFPTTGSAAETPQASMPISAKSRTSILFPMSEPVPLAPITISETTPSSFTDDSEYTFAVSHEPFDYAAPEGTAHQDTFQNRLSFVVEGEQTLTADGVTLSYWTENDNLVVKIHKNDPDKLESFTLTDLSLQQNPQKKAILREHHLYVAFSDSVPDDRLEQEMQVLKEDFIVLEQFYPNAQIDSQQICLSLNTNTLTVNGIEKSVRVSPYVSENGYVMLPLRELATALPNLEVTWDKERNTACLYTADLWHDLLAEIPLGSQTASFHGQPLALREPATEKDGRTFLSLRDAANICGIRNSEITWDAETQTVRIDKDFITYT